MPVSGMGAKLTRDGLADQVHCPMLHHQPAPPHSFGSAGWIVLPS